MREELTRLEEQLRRVFEGEAWHGPAVLEVLAGVSVEAAAAHPIPGSHSIWEIVLHRRAIHVNDADVEERTEHAANTSKGQSTLSLG